MMTQQISLVVTSGYQDSSQVLNETPNQQQQQQTCSLNKTNAIATDCCLE